MLPPEEIPLPPISTADTSSSSPRSQLTFGSGVSAHISPGKGGEERQHEVTVDRCRESAGMIEGS